MSFFSVKNLVKNMKLSIFDEIWGILKSVANKIFLFFVSELRYKTVIGISVRKIKNYDIGISRKFQNMKELIFSEKYPISRKKFFSKIIFFFRFILKSENFVEIDWFLVDIWQIYDFQIMIIINTVCIRKIWTKWEKNDINKIILSFDFTIVSENLVQICSLVTEIQNFEENMCSILYSNFFKRLWPI